MKKLVTTVSGKEVSKKECKKVKDLYYLIGDITIENSGDCYLIPEENKHIRLNSGRLVYDHSVKRYVISANVYVIKGIVAFNEEQEPILGSFSLLDSNNYDTRVRYDGNTYNIVNDDLLKSNTRFMISMYDNMYYDRNKVDSIQFYKIGECNQDYKRGLSYDSRNIMTDYIKMYKQNYKPTITNNVSKYGPLIGDLTFGLEFETVRGTISPSITNNLGLIPLRDGSIRGLEYVTIPLQGNKGLQTVIDCVEELNNKTEYDNNCSLHLHLGNIPRTEKFFLALYKMLYILQDNIFEMFPLHKKYNYGIKRKHYTKPLDVKSTILLMDPIMDNVDDIRKNFSILYKYLSMGQNYSDVDSQLKNVHSHPSDPEGRSKWNIRSRYYWVNLIPLLFGNKQTVEFRIHTPTTDINKVMNYMYICAGIVNFTIKHQTDILTTPQTFTTLSLHDIISNVYNINGGSGLYRDITNYMDIRKKYFFRKTASGDLIAEENDFKYKSRIPWGNSSLQKVKPYINKGLYTKDELKTLKGINNDYIKKKGVINDLVGEPPSFTFESFGAENPSAVQRMLRGTARGYGTSRREPTNTSTRATRRRIILRSVRGGENEYELENNGGIYRFTLNRPISREATRTLDNILTWSTSHARSQTAINIFVENYNNRTII